MMRKVLAWAILVTFTGTVVEIEAAGLLRQPNWLRAPLTGSVIAGGLGVLHWATRQFEQEMTGDS